jgi:hypothetical protein
VSTVRAAWWVQLQRSELTDSESKRARISTDAIVSICEFLRARQSVSFVLTRSSRAPLKIDDRRLSVWRHSSSAVSYR